MDRAGEAGEAEIEAVEIEGEEVEQKELDRKGRVVQMDCCYGSIRMYTSTNCM